MINLNSPIKPPLTINEGKQAVPGKDSSYLSETPIWGQSDSLYRSLSPSINSLQAKETLKQTDPSTASAPYGGKFEVCRNQIPKRRMYVPPHKLADSNSEIQAPNSVLLEAQHLVTIWIHIAVTTRKALLKQMYISTRTHLCFHSHLHSLDQIELLPKKCEKLLHVWRIKQFSSAGRTVNAESFLFPIPCFLRLWNLRQEKSFLCISAPTALCSLSLTSKG